MTVIAWDGQQLAADRLAVYGGTRLHSKKIHRIQVGKRDYLVGFAGHRQRIQHYLAWMRAGMVGDPPQGNEVQTYTMLAIDERRRVWTQEDGSPWMRARISAHPYIFAIGSGRGEALGAMLMGASAKQAVEVTCRLLEGCGGGVDVLIR